MQSECRAQKRRSARALRPRARLRRRAERRRALDQGDPPARAGVSPPTIWRSCSRRSSGSSPPQTTSSPSLRRQRPGVIGLFTRNGFKLLYPLPVSGAGRGGRSRREPAQAGARQPPRARAHLRARLARGGHGRSCWAGRRRVPAEACRRSQEWSASRTTGAVWLPRAPTSSPSPVPGMAYRSLEG